MSELTKFYRNEPNLSGYTYDQVMDWDDRTWDECHDFIQWLFPTDELSAFNSEAPVLTKEDVDAFNADQEVMWRYVLALSRARNFLCMRPYTTSFGGAWWDSPHDHNLRRVSRIIRSMALIRCRADADRFMKDAWAICKSSEGEALKFWRENVEATLQ